MLEMVRTQLRSAGGECESKLSQCQGSLKISLYRTDWRPLEGQAWLRGVIVNLAAGQVEASFICILVVGLL